MYTSILLFHEANGRAVCTTNGDLPEEGGRWTLFYCEDVSGSQTRPSTCPPAGWTEADLQHYLSQVRCLLGKSDRRWFFQEVANLLARLQTAAVEDQFDLCCKVESVLDTLTTTALETAAELNQVVFAYLTIAMNYFARGDANLLAGNYQRADFQYTFGCNRLELARALFEGDTPENARQWVVDEHLMESVLTQLDIGRSKENTPEIWILSDSVERTLVGRSPDDPHALECAELAEGHLRQMLIKAEAFYGRFHFLIGLLLYQIAECQRIQNDREGAIATLKDARVRSMEWGRADADIRLRIETDLAALLSGWDGDGESWGSSGDDDWRMA